MRRARLPHACILCVATLVLAVTATVAAPGSARAQTQEQGSVFPPARPQPGRTVDLPEQIPLEGAAGDAVRIEGIEPADGADPVAVEQPLNAVDLCDPSVPEEKRRRAGVKCSGPEVQAPPPTPGLRPRVGSADDPLLTPSDRNAREGFKELDLGKDVPATVILQN